MLAQLATKAHVIMDQLKPLIDQPVIRFPYTMSTRVPLVIPAGATGQPFVAADFQHALEYPFEINRVKPTQDPAHTFADWRLGITDQTFSMPWFKTGTQLVQGLIADNTGLWWLDFPWIVRPKGGALTLTGDNLDTVNPISVNVEFAGYLLIPRA